VNFYLDEDISPKVAQILRKRGVDAISVHEIGMAGASDEEQFSEAVFRKAALVTRNRDDFIALTIRAFESASPHHGVVVLSYSIPGSDFKHAAQMLERLAKKNPAGLAAYAIEFVSKSATG
jgi:predicted nuclease of predicted toxin-antitoxin system